MSSKQFVVFSIGEEEYAIDINRVNIIERPLEVFKIPNTPDFIEGVINLRGKVHPLLSLRKRFELKEKERDDNTRFIIASVNSSAIGLIVDQVNRIMSIDEETIEDIPQTLDSLQKKFVNAVAKVNDKIILILDIDSTVKF